MNHMELQQELAKHESNPSGMKKTQQLQDEKLAITQELEVSNVSGQLVMLEEVSY